MSLTNDELWRRLVCALVVAGKSAGFAEKVIGRLFRTHHPLDCIRLWRKVGCTTRRLEEARSGNYRKLTRAFHHLADHYIDLRTCTIEDLEAIPGCGPKTARFFLVWTRGHEAPTCAVLDVHVMRWLRQRGHPAAPEHTPPRSKYPYWESVFIQEAVMTGKHPADLDKEIWDAATNNSGQGKWGIDLEEIRRDLTTINDAVS